MNSGVKRKIAIAIGALAVVGLGLWELFYNTAKMSPEVEGQITVPEATVLPSVTVAPTSGEVPTGGIPAIAQIPAGGNVSAETVQVTPSLMNVLVGVSAMNSVTHTWIMLPNVEVWYGLSGSEQILAKGTTNAAGVFLFKGLQIGATYQFNFKAPPGYVNKGDALVTLNYPQSSSIGLVAIPAQ